MTIVEYRPAHTIDDDAAVQAIALLVADPTIPDSDAVPVVVLSPSGAPLDPFSRSTTLLPGLTGGFPVLNEWIVDLTLRNGRITIMTEHDVLCSAALLPTPAGWMAAVAASGMLDVVLEPEVVVGTSGDTCRRAVRDDGLIAAQVPVCLT